MIRSYDYEVLRKAVEPYKDRWNLDDFKLWMCIPYNVMLVEGEDVGLGTFEYPGVYSVHWYYKNARGREAINLGKKMCKYLFDKCDAKTLRAFVSEDLKASRWATRQVGFKSLGMIKFPDSKQADELYYMTKQDFEKDNQDG